MFYPMMMYPPSNSNFQMPMPTSTQEGDKNNPQQPMVMMMPVYFCDPSKMPKDMKFPNMPYPMFPYPMTYPQNNQENK